MRSATHGDGHAGLIGIDQGAATLEVVLCAPSGDVRHKVSAPSRGRPSATLAGLLGGLPFDLSGDASVRMAVTGSGHAFASDLGVTFVNEVIATSRGVQDVYPAARTILDLGAQFSKWILLGADPARPGTVADFASNGLCAAGAGAFLEHQASRLGLDVDALGRLAAGAARGASIAGRCSVFAKSDMIHLQQKGTPPDEIAYGLCLALARTFLATVVQGRAVAPPVVLIGGGARNPGLVRAFAEVLKLGAGALVVPDAPEFLGALGAARLAEAVTTVPRAVGRLGRRPTTVTACERETRPALPPLGRVADFDGRGAPEAAGVGRVPAAYLGVDVGSVSTNLVLLDPDLALVQGVYLPTRGRPVEALGDGLRQLARDAGREMRILGVGTTGSGRHLAASLLGADIVRNEITAQLTAALAIDPAVDTVFEIGGQDSKYIAVRDGRLADFEMNKICAGGTGSFLEEQAARLGIQIVDQFAALAFAGRAPCDLGARCTVFMDTELARALERDAPIEDVCAGLAYAVARNYLEKVVAGRPVGRAILFQGGTASNAAVVEAFRQLLGRPVRVHPHNRLSGAIGAARLAARARLARSAFRGFDACVGAVRRTFECQRCENRCQVNRIEVDGRAAHFGDICERYSERDRPAATAARPFPELFAAREALSERATVGPGLPPSSGPRIGLVRASLNLEFLPLWATFLRALGYEPVVSDRTTPALMQAHAQGVPAEVCLPIKAAAAHARALVAGGAVERLFVPAIVECPPPEGGDQQSHTCFYAQQLPDMLRADLRDRIVTAQFSLGRGLLSLVEPTLKLAEAFDRPADAVLRALRKANAAHARFVAERRALGQAALEASFDRAVVVLGRPYNTHDGFLNLWLARLVDRLGLAAIPWDLLPLDRVQLDPRWHTVPWHYSREQLRAIALVRDDPRLFPILISSYGCGPDAFVVKHLEELLAHRPRLLLEFDEHRGEAGLVTRLEAFADEIDEHLRRGEDTQAAATLTPGPRAQPAGRRFFLPEFLPHAHVYAAVLRGQGHEATVLPPPDEASVRLGEQLASGRECHPYAIMGGDLARLLQHTTPRRGDVFLFPSCTSPCLLRQYGDGYRILLDRHGAGELEVWDADLGQFGQFVGVTGLMQLYEGLLATDILLVLASRLRPYQARPEVFDRRVTGALARFVEAVAAKQSLDRELAGSADALWSLPRSGAPGTRPVVGVTGDLYTRMNPIGNAGLFGRFERMGIEVWPSPYFATMADLSAALQLPHSTETGALRSAAVDYLTTTMAARIQRQLVQRLPAEVAALAVEPPASELIQLARPYVGSRTNHLILLITAKTADFLRRGAMGVVSAAGINCMVGTSAAALIPALRADFGGAPIISLNYGGTEGPAQRIRLETFVEQVLARWRRRAA